MRIAVFVWDFPIISETFVVNQVIGFIFNGHEVHIYPQNPYHKQPERCHDDVDACNLMSHVKSYPYLPNTYFRSLIKFLWLILKKFPHHPIASLKALKYIRSYQLLKEGYVFYPLLGEKYYDVAYCQFGTTAIDFLNLDQFKDFYGKLIVAFRGHDISKFIKENGEQVYNELFSVMDLALPNSQYFKDRLIALGCDSKKIQIVYSGIQWENFAYFKKSWTSGEQLNITFCGRLVEKKGLAFALQALAKFKNNFCHFNYTIIGDGILKDELMAMVDKLDLKDQVRFVGSQTHTNVMKYLEKTHIFLAPSVTAANGDEDSITNTLKEAMCMGVPVIGTYHGGIPELVIDGKTGYLVKEWDVDHLAEVLLHMIGDAKEWTDLGLRAREYVIENFAQEKSDDKLEKLFTSMVGK